MSGQSHRQELVRYQGLEVHRDLRKSPNQKYINITKRPAMQGVIGVRHSVEAVANSDDLKATFATTNLRSNLQLHQMCMTMMPADMYVTGHEDKRTKMPATTAEAPAQDRDMNLPREPRS